MGNCPAPLPPTPRGLWIGEMPVRILWNLPTYVGSTRWGALGSIMQGTAFLPTPQSCVWGQYLMSLGIPEDDEHLVTGTARWPDIDAHKHAEG